MTLQLFRVANVGVGNSLLKATSTPLLDFISPLTKFFKNIDLCLDYKELF